ncbi:MAG TPA: GNAT family N-acetyltransferase [Alphaproteobacteria bacterium]|nr:GNAT family N-acetyltransferase [Alphaproteobacteria bacterium]
MALPYPKDLELHAELPGLGLVFVRPVRPEDGPAFHAGFARLSPEDIRMRFFAPMKELPDDMAYQLTHIDYDREMAFVMLREREGDLVGVSRMIMTKDQQAEFAVVVRSDLKGRGIGRFLMARLVHYARARNVRELYGDILSENTPMIEFMRGLGFHIEQIPESEAIMRATCRLNAPLERP